MRPSSQRQRPVPLRHGQPPNNDTGQNSYLKQTNQMISALYVNIAISLHSHVPVATSSLLRSEIYVLMVVGDVQGQRRTTRIGDRIY